MKNKKVLKIILNVFIWIFVAFSAFMTVLSLAASTSPDGIPSLAGTAFMTVASDSMEDTIMTGDLITAKKLSDTEKQQLEVGDVITFYKDLDGDGNEEINTHRIIEIVYEADGTTVDGYKTKGDHNQLDDPGQVMWQFVIAEWTGTRIPLVGGFIGFIQKPTGFLCCIVLPLIVFFLYELFVFIKALLAVKTAPAEAGAAVITAAKEEEIRQKAIDDYLKAEAEKKAQAEREEEIKRQAVEEYLKAEAEKKAAAEAASEEKKDEE
jgi:signal peptidase